MALLINKEVSIMGGVKVPSAYIRVEYHVDYSGTRIEARIRPYVSKEAYKENMQNIIKIDGFESPAIYYISYDPTSNLDVFETIHNHIKDQISTDILIYHAKKDLNEKYIYDDQGQKIYEPEIARPKFCDPDHIEIVDIN